MTEIKDSQDEPRTSIKKGLKINRYHFQGFIAAILIMTIVFLGVLVTSPKTLTGTAIFQPVNGFTVPVITSSTFKHEVLESKVPVIVYYTYAKYEGEYMNDMLAILDDSFVGDVKAYPVAQNYFEDLDYDDQVLPRMELYIGGKLIDRLELIKAEHTPYLWVRDANNKINPPPTPAPTPTPTPAPTPTPVPVPTVYRTFPKSIIVSMEYSEYYDSILGELLLASYDIDAPLHDQMDTVFMRSRKDIRLPVKDNDPLYHLIGNDYGGDSDWFGLPDLSGQSPLEGLDYFFVTQGTFPHTEPNSEIPAEEINYFPYDFYNYNYSGLFVGQIILAKDIDPLIELYRVPWVPCDGRTLSISRNASLYSLMGNEFGGDEVSFNLPDLTGFSPIDGAKYYITTEGIFPTRK